MSQHVQAIFRRLPSYWLSALLALSAMVLVFSANALLATSAGVIAALSFLHTWALVKQLSEADVKTQEAQEQLGRAQVFSSVDELSAGIAHEINNPLGIIAQETQWIEHILKGPAFSGSRETEDCKDSLREISRQVDRCKEIVQKLLGLARQMEPVIQRVDINDLVQDMMMLVDREVSRKNIKITSTLAPDLPFVSTDPPLLRQVLLNLLVNATDAIERDGMISITTRAAEKDAIDVVVQDSGCGIPKEHLSKIFRPFFSTKPEGKGTGLGLALCRGIIERLGGTISVVSDVGKTTAFTIHIPVNRPPNPEEETDASATKGAHSRR